MTLIKYEKLKEKIEDYKLIPIEINSLNISNQIYLNMDNYEDFLRFSRDSNHKHIYYYYTYYNPEEYIIPTDWYSEYSKEFKMVVNKHNRYIKSLDLTHLKN